MLGYIFLVLLQFFAAFLGGPQVMGKLPVSLSGDQRTFAQAIVYAFIVWLVGFVASFALRDVRRPSTEALVAALAGGLIGATIMFVPQAMNALQSIVKFPPQYLPIGLAIVGYMLRR